MLKLLIRGSGRSYRPNRSPANFWSNVQDLCICAVFILFVAACTTIVAGGVLMFFGLLKIISIGTY